MNASHWIKKGNTKGLSASQQSKPVIKASDQSERCKPLI
jgi:hypothetical protein